MHCACVTATKVRTSEDVQRELTELLGKIGSRRAGHGSATEAADSKASLVQEWLRLNSNQNTRRTYDSSVGSFQKHLAKADIKMTEVKACDVAEYLIHRTVVDGVAASTVAGDKAAIADALKYTPLREVHLDPLVKDTLKVCTNKAAQSQPKQHMSADLLAELVAIHDRQKPDWLAARNIAMLLVMMAGMLRESEATMLRMDDVEFQLSEVVPAAATTSASSAQQNEAMTIWIGRSKTDQAGKGAAVMIAANNDSPSMCPVRRLRQFVQMRSAAGIRSEFVFCTKDGKAMAKSTPCGIVQRQVENANQIAEKEIGTSERWGPSKSYGSHSLRRGGVTEARRNGAEMLEIQRHGRWKSAVVWDYVGPTVEQRLNVTRQLFSPVAHSAPITPKKVKFKARDPMTPKCEPWTGGRGEPWNHMLVYGSLALDSGDQPSQLEAPTGQPPGAAKSPARSPVKRKRVTSSSDESDTEEQVEANAAEEVALDQEMESWQGDDRAEPPLTRSRRGLGTAAVKATIKAEVKAKATKKKLLKK